MRKIFLILTFGVFVAGITGCATIMRENSQNVPISANVEKVDVKITNKAGKVVFEGQTPTTINLKTAEKGYFNPEKYTITASKDGFNTQTTVVDWHVSGWYWAGNFMFGGLLGLLIIDPLTGDMYYLDEEVNLDMLPENK